MATTCASYTSSILFGGMRERRRMCFDKGCSCWTKFDHNWSILTFLGKFDKILMSIAFTITMRQDVNTSETLVTEILMSSLPSRSQPVQPYFPTLHFMSVFALKTTKSPALPKSAQWEERLWRGRKSSELTLKDFPPAATLMDFPPVASSFRLILNPVWLVRFVLDHQQQQQHIGHIHHHLIINLFVKDGNKLSTSESKYGEWHKNHHGRWL